jgi:hypothetical protein
MTLAWPRYKCSNLTKTGRTRLHAIRRSESGWTRSPTGSPREKNILERGLRKRLRSYEKGTGFRVTEVLVRQEGYPVEVRVDLLAYPQRLLKARRKTLGEDIEGLLNSFEQDTQGRIAEILVEEGQEGYIVKVRLACGGGRREAKKGRVSDLYGAA